MGLLLTVQMQPCFVGNQVGATVFTGQHMGVHGFRGMHGSGTCTGQRVCMGKGVHLGQRVSVRGSVGVHGFKFSVLYFFKLAHGTIDHLASPPSPLAT